MKTILLGSNKLSVSIIVILFLFFFIFGMPTPIGSLTPLLALGVIIWGVLNFKVYFLYFPKEILFLFLFLFLDLLVCLFVPILMGTYDFSIIQTKINLIASLLATYVLARSFCLNKKISDKQFFNLLLVVFFIQAILVVAMLVNSDLSQLITSFTRNSDQGARVLDTYAGARGLGIADSSAFGFAIVMGLFIFLTFVSYKNKFIGLKFFSILILIGGIASVSAGRTAILGLILGLIYSFLDFKNARSLKILILIFIIIFVAGVFLLNIDRDSIQNETLRYFYSYSMEPILNYMNEGSLVSSSTDALQNMYFPLTEQQYLIGDGRYMDGESYYMFTDAGYMRFALFYGGVFSLMLYGYFTYFVVKVASFNKKYLVPLFFLLLLSFALHYKGEVIFLAVSYGKVFFLLLFFIYLRSIKLS